MASQNRSSVNDKVKLLFMGLLVLKRFMVIFAVLTEGMYIFVLKSFK